MHAQYLQLRSISSTCRKYESYVIEFLACIGSQNPVEASPTWELSTEGTVTAQSQLPSNQEYVMQYEIPHARNNPERLVRAAANWVDLIDPLRGPDSLHDHNYDKCKQVGRHIALILTASQADSNKAMAALRSLEAIPPHASPPA